MNANLNFDNYEKLQLYIKNASEESLKILTDNESLYLLNRISKSSDSIKSEEDKMIFGKAVNILLDRSFKSVTLEGIEKDVLENQINKIKNNLEKIITLSVFYSPQKIKPFVKDIDDVTVSMRSLLEVNTQMTQIYNKQGLKKYPLLMPQEPGKGMSGKVKYVRFKTDPISNQWFAIKREGGGSKMFNNIFNTSDKKTIDHTINYYKNNVDVAKKIGDHPNFTKVYGVVIKTTKQNQSKPYLIMEFVHDAIQLKKFSGEHFMPKEKISLVSQLKDSILHLYKCNIFPQDLNFGNILIDKENLLKFIDYDAWQIDPKISSQELATGLYEHACRITQQLASPVELKFDNFNGSTLEQLEKALENLVEKFAKLDQVKPCSLM